LTGPGSLFVRWGHIFGPLSNVQAVRGGPPNSRVLAGANFPDNVNTVLADFAAGDPVQQVTDGIYNDTNGLQQGTDNIFTLWQTRAKNCLLAMYSLDQGVSPNAPLGVLTSPDLTAALNALASQMRGAGASIQSSVPTLGAQTAVGTPNGNPVIVLSVKDPQGRTLQAVFDETLTFSAAGDSQAGATLGNEPVSVKGQPLAPGVFSPLWPGGSGASGTLNLVDGSKSNAAGNLLVNSDWSAYSTPNLPDNWVALRGLPATDIFNGTPGGPYTPGGGALQFTGTGSPPAGGVAVYQPFNTATSVAPSVGGTPAQLKPDRQYAGNLWIKTSATPTAGAAELALTDLSDTVVNDDQAASNAAVRTLTNISTVWTNFPFVFRTPSVLPSGLRLRLRLSTAIDSGKSAYFGRLAFGEMQPVYKGGPSWLPFSGSNKVIAGLFPDTWTVDVNQTWGGFVQWLERMFGLREKGIIISNSGTPTIADSLIS
jgi:hypothetical protein